MGRPVGGSIGRPVAGCWPRLLAFQRGGATSRFGAVSPAENECIRRVHTPVIDGRHTFTSSACAVSGTICGSGSGGCAVIDAVGTGGEAADNDALNGSGADTTSSCDRSDAVRARGRVTRNNRGEPPCPDSSCAVSGAAPPASSTGAVGVDSASNPTATHNTRRSRHVGGRPPADSGGAISAEL